MNDVILSILLAPFCCNKNHYFTVRIGGKNRRFCTRSVPLIFGAISTISLILSSKLMDWNGTIVALMGILLVLPDLFYWAFTRIRLLPDLISIRIVTGFMIGVGIMIFGQASIPIIYKVSIPLAFILAMVIADRIIKPI